MNHFIISAWLAFLSACLAALLSFLMACRSRSKVLILATLYWASISFWAFFVASQGYTLNKLSPFLWGWLLHIGCTLIPVLLFHMAIMLTGEKTQATRWTLLAAYVVTAGFNLLNAITDLFTHGTAFRDSYAYPKPSFLYPLYFLLFVWLVTWATLMMIRHILRVPQKERRTLKLLLAAQVFAYIGGMDNFLIMVDVRIFPLYPYGLYAVPLYAGAMIYAVYASNLFRSSQLWQA